APAADAGAAGPWGIIPIPISSIGMSARPSRVTVTGESMFAIIETGGKEDWVAPGQAVDVEKLPSEAGETVQFDRVLFISDGRDGGRRGAVAGWHHAGAPARHACQDRRARGRRPRPYVVRARRRQRQIRKCNPTPEARQCVRDGRGSLTRGTMKQGIHPEYVEA